MAKLRSVSTAFWSDPFIEDLSPSEKLLFIYLITNEKTNMLGIYESSIKKMSFETGINKPDIDKALKGFETVGKVKYINNYVILVNYMKHQHFNTNMKKSAIDVYNDLPNGLKDSKLIISKDKPLEGFESLLNHYGMVSKVEDEVEAKAKDEVEAKIIVDEPLDLFNLYNSTIHNMPKAISLSKSRKESINARIKEHSFDICKDAIMVAANSDFLNGKSEKGWTANIDWIFKPSNFTKIIEGNYINTKNNETNDRQTEYQRAQELAFNLENYEGQDTNNFSGYEGEHGVLKIDQ